MATAVAAAVAVAPQRGDSPSLRSRDEVRHDLGAVLVQRVPSVLQPQPLRGALGLRAWACKRQGVGVK